ncbi:MAG TPA: ATP-binding protein [Gemmataceae bacterium]|nr:ATP-binding protein [Gemmataceae bacterium]
MLISSESAQTAVVGLEDILITEDLSRRPVHPPDLPAENRALHALARHMAHQPREMLKSLVVIALELCRAGTAGVSLRETTASGEDVFRWAAVAGVYEGFEGVTTPGHFSPCAICVERGSPQLYSYPARHFTYLQGVEPDIVEGLVIPLVAGGHALGAIWIVTHDEQRKFDAGDVRVLSILADFTAAALHLSATAEENARLYQEAHEADQRKDEFLAMLAHELRNPLAPLKNAVQVMRIRGADVPDLRWAREVVERQVHQMTRLVDDLLDISRVGRGKLSLERAVVDLSAVINQAVETSRPLIDARKHELTVAVPPRPMKVRGDKVRLIQVVSNLLNNAAKYSEGGGHIWLSMESAGGEAVVRVRDTGVGIDPDLLPHIFDLFMQGDRLPDSSQSGLGVGLSLVRKLVDLHDGTVQASSDGPGQGSEFVVRLPLTQEKGQEADEDRPVLQHPAVAKTCGHRVLVIDDNVDAAESIAVLLRLWGHDGRTAYDGKAGLEVARVYEPEIVLLDIGLPGMSGYEVARLLRQEFGCDRPTLVAMTGYGRKEDYRRSKEAGFDHHFTKPVDTDALQELLANLDWRRGGNGSSAKPSFKDNFV